MSEKSTRLIEGVLGSSGKGFSEPSIMPRGRGRWVPAATLVGSLENLGCERWRIDFMLPKRDKDAAYLLLPSVLGMTGLLRVFVEADRLSEGIMDVFMDFTLAERASEAFVGVVTALGRPVFVGILIGVA